jgi:hypothetical protein
MEDINIIVVVVVSIVLGQRVLAIIFPKASQSSVARLGFGTVQVASGITLCVVLAHDGWFWLWPITIALWGMYNLWLGWGQQKARLRQARQR